MSEVMIKMAADHSSTKFYNTVMMTDTLLPFAIMFSGPNVEVVHLLGMF